MHLVTLIISAVLALLGTIAMLISAIGIIRLPDFYARISAVTKNSTLGVVLVMAAAVVYFNNIEVLLKGLGIIFFIALTSPTSAYIIAKAAVHVRVAFWSKTNLKDFRSLEEEDIEDEEEDFRVNKAKLQKEVGKSWGKRPDY